MSFALTFIFLTLKNIDNVKYLSLSSFFERNYNLLELKNLAIQENIQIYKSSHNDGFCYDKYGICIDSDLINFKIINYKGWYYFKG